MNDAVDVWTDPDLAELVHQDAALIAVADALVAGTQMHATFKSRRRRRVAIAVAVLVLTAAALVPAVALSKGLRTLIGLAAPAPVPRGPSVKATLTSHIPTSARPGAQVRMSWKLWSRNHGQIVPFASHGIFARIVNPTRTAVSTAPAHGRHGHYSAVVRVPSGGIGRVQIGILATRFTPNGEHAARFLFPITNYP